MSKKNNKEQPRQYYVLSELIIPFIFLFLFALINLYVGVHIGSYAIIFLVDEAYILALSIGIFLYIHFSKYVVSFYTKYVRWKKPVFYILYYIIYFLMYTWAYSYHLYYINNVSNTFITSEFGAALSFTYRIYPAYILLQIISKVIRFIYIKIKESEKGKILGEKIKKVLLKPRTEE